MKLLQLFKDGKQLLGSDGILYVDGRFNAQSIKLAVIERNKKYNAYFQHKIADSFSIYNGRIGSSLGKIANL